ncbi:hypothetical protein ACS0TY_007721 [Phlomoides rotata]
MEEGKVLFDASAYMLFEASGDSDAQCFDEMDSGAAEDDAQSCIFESVSGGAPWNEAVDAGSDFYRGADFDGWSEDEDEDGGASCDEEDGVVDQCHRQRTAAAKETPVKSNGCEDSKMMNERERDRQFWEACLAS